MHNWSDDESQIKQDPEKYKIWRLEQLINYGASGAKLREKEIRKYWSKLRLDPGMRRALSFLIYGKRDSQ